MRKIFVAALVIGSMLVFPSTSLPVNAVDNQVERGYISVSYTTEKEISPDTVEFSISIKTNDKKSMQEASTKNKEISNKVYDYLKANINTSNGDYLKTANYSATPVYIYKDGKRIFDKYEVSNNIIVHTKSLDKVSNYIDKSIQLGATDVNSLNFTLSNKDAQCVDMLAESAKQVKQRANVVTAAVGSSVTGIKNIRTSCSVNQRRVGYGYTNRLMAKAVMSDGAMEEAAPQTNIESGNITMYASVDADFFVK
ncbi:SIMPL domain-containing protein [bacterium]|nr:SIMPL domain-containing protein [bacterium]